MPVLTLFFLAGILLVQQCSELPDVHWLIIGGMLISFCGWQRYWRVGFFILGLLWATLFAMNRMADRLPKELEGKEFNITGVISSLPKREQHRVSFDFDIIQAAEKLPPKIRLSWYDSTQTVKAGQHWQFTVKLKRPHGMFNPTGFDYETFLFTQNIGAIGYIRKPPPHLLGTERCLYNVNVCRQAISDCLTELLRDRDSLALIKALSIGDGSEITEAQWQVFRKTGTIHLIVISGSHISLVAGFVFLLARQLWARTGILAISPPTFAAMIALLAAIAYAALAGFSVSTQRALIMVTVIMFGIMFQRHIKPINSIALALFLILIFDPLAVLSAGFWLSFIAVIMLLYCSLNRLGKPSRFFVWINIHFVMTLALSPVLLFFFQQVALIATPPANFVAIPGVEFVAVPQILLVTLLIFWQPHIASKLLLFIAKQLNGLYWLLNELAKIPVLNYPQPSGWATLLAMLGMMLLFAPKGIPARWLSVVLCFPLVFVETEKISAGEMKLTLLDVGQGLSAVLQTQNHLLVFDTGAKSSADFDMGKAVLIPFLHHLQATHIDRLIVSHGDNDHSGGTQSLLAEIKPDSIYSSVPQLFPNNAAISCVAGQQWQWDKVKFMMLSPAEIQYNNDNNNSCVLKVELASGSILLTGDIEAKTEQKLVNSFANLLKSDVLIAPHHGSKTSSTADFLAQIKPQFILIPAAYKNRYHFPHPSVIERYQQAQIKWLMTGTAGAITVKISKDGLKTFAYRISQAKYWHDK